MAKIHKINFIIFIFLVLLTSGCFCANFSFAVLGDSHDNYTVLRDIISSINADPDIKFAINNGDITESGFASQYRRYWDITSTANVKVYDVIGNHDLGAFNGGVKVFEKKYKKTYYYFDRDGCRFILINNASASGLGKDQWEWLKGVLDTKKTLFVFMHEPLFDISGYYPDHIMHPLTENEKLKKLLTDSGVKHVFAGHIHGYGKQKENGVTYIITAGAGGRLYMPARDGGFYHYVKVTVSGKRVTDQVVRLYMMQ